MKRGLWGYRLAAAGVLATAMATAARVGAAEPPVSSTASTPSDSPGPTGDTRRGGWLIVPSISVMETYTDNVTLAPSGREESDFITSVMPSLRVEGNSARAKLSLNYRRQQLLYAGDSDRNSGQNFLNAAGTLEAVERLLYIDAGASITQQAISAFGSQPTVTENVDRNRAETATYYVSPYVRGRFGSAAEYTLRYKRTMTNSSVNAFSDSDINDFTGAVRSISRGTLFGWALDANKSTTHFDTRRSIELRLLRGTLFYHYDPELTFLAIAGHESNNYASPSMEDKATYGAGFEWTPSPRTRAAGTAERRFFGDSHDFTLTHRTPLSSWQYSDRRMVTVLPNQLALTSPGTAFDLLFNALTSRFPDPIARAQEVERLLQQTGTPANLGLQTGFLTTRAFVEQVRQASVAMLGVRNTITFTATMSQREGIGAAGGTPDDFTLSPEIDTRSLSISWAHKLSAVTSANVIASHIQSKGAAGTNLETEQNTVRLLFTHRFGPRTSGTLGLRYVRFDGTTGQEYTERAVTASVSTTF